MATRKITTATLYFGLMCVVHAAALEPTLVNNTTTSAPERASVSTNTTTTSTATPLNIVDTTIITPNESQLDNDESMARQAVEGGRAVTPIGTKELDGRSAYINNQYVADEAPLSYNDTSPPLYQFLQEQMEQILASSLPGEYRLENNAANKESSAVGKEMTTNGYGVPALQNAVSSPVFAYGGTNFQEEDDDLIGAYGKAPDDKYYPGIAPTKPSTMELPKPIKVHNIITRPKLTHTATTTSTTTTTETPKAPSLGGYGGGQVSLSEVAAAPQYKPQVSNNNNNGYGSQPMSSYKPQIKEEYYSPNPSKYTYVRQNSTVHMRKRRITFKTVASASQIISTPLADLMFKYSIGVAKPSMAAGGNSLFEHDDQPVHNSPPSGYNDNLDLPKHAYSGKISHSSHRKN
ncbi:mediator of RNA polymerase II transcription subunit 13 [Bactrocera dorsalis]|uniref:Mediator of RNA polymerase II transcription subunit 13 n=1 Tax=Bactrocera dorsalis TaxID=27457 RepID=A0ABM3JZY6_BACDO|nr:mediator of RNA polymerase II transcription subunit 13 [Bactrocera dorsalis]